MISNKKCLSSSKRACEAGKPVKQRGRNTCWRSQQRCISLITTLIATLRGVEAERNKRVRGLPAVGHSPADLHSSGEGVGLRGIRNYLRGSFLSIDAEAKSTDGKGTDGNDGKADSCSKICPSKEKEEETLKTAAVSSGAPVAEPKSKNPEMQPEPKPRKMLEKNLLKKRKSFKEPWIKLMRSGRKRKRSLTQNLTQTKRGLTRTMKTSGGTTPRRRKKRIAVGRSWRRPWQGPTGSTSSCWTSRQKWSGSSRSKWQRSTNKTRTAVSDFEEEKASGK
ncbi:unnamed protein product [Amoebophrya sp. A25]|nr:unnamed protein product [Amoebophrya sp. A25]|eukprot:GSA25T00018595001.1